jgi:hypothetical protein
MMYVSRGEVEGHACPLWCLMMPSRGQRCEFLGVWSVVRGGLVCDLRGQLALLRETHGLLSPLEGRFTEGQESQMAGVELALGDFLWTAGRGAEGEPLLRSVLRRPSASVVTRVGAMRQLADTALQRGEVDEAERLCDEALALTGETPDGFRVSTWVECRVQLLALRGSVEECRGDLKGARRYDLRAGEVVEKYGGFYPVHSRRRCALRLLQEATDPSIVVTEIAWFGEEV